MKDEDEKTIPEAGLEDLATLRLTETAPGTTKSVEAPIGVTQRIESQPPLGKESPIRSGSLQSSSEADVPLKWSVGDVILGLYEVQQIHSGGGMGIVYRVRHREWDVDLAVKAPREEYVRTEEQKEDFERECKAWVKLGLHPNIVSCRYVRRLGGIPRVFAEYVEGGSLSDWIRERKLYEGGQVLAVERMLDIAIQFAWGLHYAHEQGLAHQDVKPANVMMTPDGTAKVTDFGLAQAQKGAFTLQYRSPEQAYGQLPSHKTDIWSWGVSVLEMFIGDLTWGAGEVALEVLEGYLETGLEDTQIPRMPGAVAELLRQCFRNEPAERPQDMLEVAGALREIYRQVTEEPYPREATKAAEGRADSLNNWAVSLLDLSEDDLALRLWNEALSHDPMHPEAIYNRGLALWRSGKMTDQQLLQQLRTVTSGDGALGARLLGEVLLERGDTEGVLATLRHGSMVDELPSVKRLVEAARDWRGVSIPDLSALQGLNYFDDPICLSSDGRLALCGSRDNNLRLWEVPTGRCLRTFVGHTDRLECIWLSPDTRWAISGSRDQTLRLWEIPTGNCLRTFKGHNDEVTSACMSSDLQWVLSGSQDQTLRLWEVASGRCQRVFDGHDRGVKAVTLSSDYRFALSGSWDDTMRLWDVSTGRCRRFFEGHNDSVETVALSRDCSLALSGGWDRTLRLWDTITAQCLRVFEKQGGRVEFVCFSNDAQWAISASADQMIRLWEVATGRCLRTFEGFISAVASICLDQSTNTQGSDKDGRSQREIRWPTPWRAAPALCEPHSSLATITVQQQFRNFIRSAREFLSESKLFEAWSYIRQARELPGFERAQESLDLAAEIALSARRKGVTGVWQRVAFGGGAAAGTTCLCLSKNGRIAVSGFAASGGDNIFRRSKGVTLNVREVSTGRPIADFHECHDGVNSVCLSPDDCFVLSGGADRKLRLWDIKTGACLRVFHGHSEPVSTVFLSRDGRWALSGSHDHTVRMWDVSTGRYLRTFRGHNDWVKSVCLSPDSSLALSGSADCTLRLWDVASGDCLNIFEGHTSVVSAVCFSPNGLWALSGSADGRLRLWQVSSGRCLRIFEGHKDGVNAICLSADGRWALSGANDHTVRLWEADSGRCLYVLEGHEKPVHSVCLSADGRCALSGSEDGGFRMWETDWDLEFPKSDGWDESVEPYLDVFLNTQSPYASADPRSPDGLKRSAKPRWNSQDFVALIEELKLNGFGWLHQELVNHKLKEKTLDRGGSWTE